MANKIQYMNNIQYINKSQDLAFFLQKTAFIVTKHIEYKCIVTAAKHKKIERLVIQWKENEWKF